MTFLSPVQGICCIKSASCFKYLTWSVVTQLLSLSLISCLHCYILKSLHLSGVLFLLAASSVKSGYSVFPFIHLFSRAWHILTSPLIETHINFFCQTAVDILLTLAEPPTHWLSIHLPPLHHSIEPQEPDWLLLGEHGPSQSHSSLPVPAGPDWLPRLH